MRSLNFDEVNSVTGGMTENQCIGITSVFGGLVGAAVGAWGTAGIGTYGGFTGGMAIGAAAGMIFCGAGSGSASFVKVSMR